jgi:primosomal protein N' (replication factor Y) (superfamily II helicase)
MGGHLPGGRHQAGARALTDPVDPAGGSEAAGPPPGRSGDTEAASGDRLVRVQPDVPALPRAFDYTVPAKLADRITVGSRVRVDLHGRRVAGWVTEDGVAATPGVAAKPLALSSGLGPPPSVVRLAEWASWRWAGPLSSFLGTASPERVVLSLPSSTAPAPMPPSPEGGAVGLVEAALASGLRSVVRLPPALDAVLVVEEVVHRMGPDGVLVLAPSHRRAGVVASRLRDRGVPVALVPEDWDRSAAGGSLTVGTRVAAWAPLPSVRAVVVLDAHDEAYREQRAPTWSAVDVVRERARRDGAPVVLVSPCPTVVLAEDASVVTPPRPLERRGWPLVEVVDRREDDPRTGLFSERLRRALGEVVGRPEGVAVCILNRTGRVPLLSCRHCGALARCARCGAAVSLVRDAGLTGTDGGPGEALACRRCGERRPVQCAICDGTRFRALRMGVSRATEELSALIGVTAVELTADSDAQATEAARRARLVVGTEAALHRVPAAALVAVLDFDQHLLAPRFAAAEEALALLARAARLLGPRDRGGRLLVQTRLPDHDAVRSAARADPGILAGSERELRASLGLPPFGALALISGAGAAEMVSAVPSRAGVTTSAAGDDRWLLRAETHSVLCDALAAAPRPAARVRVDVDPVDV